MNLTWPDAIAILAVCGTVLAALIPALSSAWKRFGQDERWAKRSDVVMLRTRVEGLEANMSEIRAGFEKACDRLKEDFHRSQDQLRQQIRADYEDLKKDLRSVVKRTGE